MPHHESIALAGNIQHVFAHRFTVEADGKVQLADLGPRGAEMFPLESGLAVRLEGERRPSEIKVTRIEADGRDAVVIEHKKPNHGPGHKSHIEPIDLERILANVTAAGWSIVQEPRPKPKHVEVLVRRGASLLMEVHVDHMGAIYKQKPADLAKWHDTRPAEAALSR